MTGVRVRVRRTCASDRFTEGAAELLFGYADRKYAAEGSRKKEWDLNSRPTVGLDPLVLSRISTALWSCACWRAAVQRRLNNRYWDVKQLRLRCNRDQGQPVGELNIPLLKNNLACTSNADRLSGSRRLPENGDTLNRPLNEPGSAIWKGRSGG